MDLGENSQKKTTIKCHAGNFFFQHPHFPADSRVLTPTDPGVETGKTVRNFPSSRLANQKSS